MRFHYPMDTEKEYAMWMVLNALPKVGPATFRRLKERFDGRIRDVFRLHLMSWQRSRIK
jgi:hypothetical protein